MENKKLKQRTATCLISNELGLEKNTWFSAGIELSRSQMARGLVEFLLTMVARDEGKNSKRMLKKRILYGLKRLY